MEKRSWWLAYFEELALRSLHGELQRIKRPPHVNCMLIGEYNGFKRADWLYEEVKTWLSSPVRC
jgi:hypothetical protein